MSRARWLSVLVAFATLGLLGGTAAASDLFEDVPSEDAFHDDIAWLADSGITRGCNPPDNSRFCPDVPVTRGQMAAFLTRALGLSADTANFSDTVGHTFEDDIGALAAADITRGCNPPDNSRFCPDQPVTRGQMAAFLTRAMNLGLGTVFFSDTVGHHFYADVAALASADITRGCNPPANTRFCPDDFVTRAQMAAFLNRALTGSGGGGGGDITDAAVSYFVVSEAVCIAHADRHSNPRPNPDRYHNVLALQTFGPDQVLIEDGTGDLLVVDFSYHPAVIYQSEGPDHWLPLDLSFGCPADLYLGTSHD